jgi:hypothetical protein
LLIAMDSAEMTAAETGTSSRFSGRFCAVITISSRTAVDGVVGGAVCARATPGNAAAQLRRIAVRICAFTGLDPQSKCWPVDVALCAPLAVCPQITAAQRVPDRSRTAEPSGFRVRGPFLGHALNRIVIQRYCTARWESNGMYRGAQVAATQRTFEAARPVAVNATAATPSREPGAARWASRRRPAQEKTRV